MSQHFPAGPAVLDLLAIVRENHPHLEQANFCCEFVDSKPFIQDRLNLGKVSKFSQSAKIWQNPQKYDFCISLCVDVWHSILTTDASKSALLDLHLSCCMVEYLPELDENEKPIKDEFGRVQYSSVVKTDEEGRPKFKVIKPDIKVIADNIRRYGLWMDDIDYLYDVINNINK